MKNVSLPYYIEFQERLMYAALYCAHSTFRGGKVYLVGSRACSYGLGRCCYALSDVDIFVEGSSDLARIYQFYHSLKHCLVNKEKMCKEGDFVNAAIQCSSDYTATPTISVKIDLPHASCVNLLFRKSIDKTVKDVLRKFDLSICRLAYEIHCTHAEESNAKRQLKAWLDAVEGKTGRKMPKDVIGLVLKKMDTTVYLAKLDFKPIFGDGFTPGVRNAKVLLATSNSRKRKAKYEARGFSFDEPPAKRALFSARGWTYGN